MEFTEAVGTCFAKFADFSGRARRSEYWWWVLFTLFGTFGLAILDAITSGSGDTGPLVALFSLVTFIPSISVTARRLHDIDRTGWWQIWPVPLLILTLMAAGVSAALAGLFTLLAALFLVIYLFWLMMRGTHGDNQFGPDPLAPFVSEE